MVNAIRGEIDVTFDGETHYTMRPTFEALAAIEAETGVSLMTLATRISIGSFVASEVVAILHLAIAEREKPSRKQIGEALFHDGYPKYRDSVVGFLTSCLTFYTGPDDGKGDDDDEDPPKDKETAAD